MVAAGYAQAETTESAEVPTDALDARAAFDKGDAAASKAYHEARPSLEGGHAAHKYAVCGNKYVQAAITAFVGGANIGTIVAAAARGAALEDTAVRAVTLLTALGCACMHAASVYLQRRSDQDYLWYEFKREQWEWENDPAGEIREMVELYEDAGYDPEDAATIINLLSKHEKKFIDIMMVDELQLMPPTTDSPPAVAPFAVAGFVGAAMGSVLFAKCTAAALGATVPATVPAPGFVGLVLCMAAVGGACEALYRYKHANYRRVIASGSFFALWLGATGTTTFWLSHKLTQP